MDLNLFRLGIKIDAGAKFIQTHAVFDIEAFTQWLDAVRKEGLAKKAAILASVFPLVSAAEAHKLRDTYAEFCIPDKVIERLKKAGDDARRKRRASPSALKPSSSSRRSRVCAGSTFFRAAGKRSCRS
jgi:5,10-methylenetetrahydrofolate reductase